MTTEEWARQIIEKELNRPVVVHDDGSQPGMYDLRVGAAGAPDVAIECVRAVDPVGAETWNVGPGRGAVHLTGVTGDWLTTISRDAHIKTLLQRVGPLLRDLEARDVRRVSVLRPLGSQDDVLLEKLEKLGIQNVARLRMPDAGLLHWTMEGNGGVIDSEGCALPGWIEDFLRHPDREDVLSKLRQSNAQERWVFVPVTLSGAPWSVESYLQGELESLPPTGPRLPSPVTGIWVTCTYCESGVRWDGSEWRLFRVQEEPDTPQ